MKHRIALTFIASVLATTGILLAQQAEPYRLLWSATTASPGVSTSNEYTLTTNIHQPAAQLTPPSTGGIYTLSSGFLAGAPPPPVQGHFWLLR
jgi:hypothetical protein